MAPIAVPGVSAAYQIKLIVTNIAALLGPCVQWIKGANLLAVIPAVKILVVVRKASRNALI